MESLVAGLLALDPKLRRVAARIATDPQDADDLVQDVWLAGLTRFPGADCALEPWALQVLRNQAARRARRPRLTSTDSELDQVEDAAAVVQTPAERREVRRHLRACIESLPEPYRGTLIERFYAARSVGDIAATRGVPRATVSTHLHRALQRLRVRLGRASDLLGVLPFFRRGSRSASAAKLATSGGAICARAFVFACIATPIVLAIAWAYAPQVRALPVEQLATVSGLEASVELGTTRIAASRIALEREAQPTGDLLRVEVLAEGSLRALSGCALSVWSEDGLQFDRTTDEQGVCHLPLELARQWLIVSVVPRGVELSERIGAAVETPFRAFARAEENSLRFVHGSGPRLPATFRAPQGVHPGGLVYGLRCAQPSSLTSPLLQVGPGSRASSWTIQLPADWTRMTDFRELALHVATQDGLLAGEARITPEALAFDEALELELEPRAALSVSILTIANEPLRSGVIRLQPREASSAWLAGPGASGNVWVPGLLPGAYSVEVIVPGCSPWKRELLLEAGRLESLTAQLIAQPRPAASAIHGRIVRKREGYDGAVIMALEGGRTPQFKRLEWVECADGFEARFKFPDVDAQVALLRPIALDGMPRFEPPISLRADSGAAIEFFCHGARTTSPIHFGVESESDAAKIDGLEFEFTLPGGTEILYRESTSTLDELPRWSVSSHDLRWKVRSGAPWDWFETGTCVSWTLSAPGYESQSGDERAWSSGNFTARLRPKSAQ